MISGAQCSQHHKLYIQGDDKHTVQCLGGCLVFALVICWQKRKKMESDQRLVMSCEKLRESLCDNDQ